MTKRGAGDVSTSVPMKPVLLLLLAFALTACGAAHQNAQARTPAAASAAPPTQWVGTRGIEVAVPAAWPLNRGRCGTPRANTVLWNEDGVLTCLVSQPPGLSAVEFGGITPQSKAAIRETIGGVRILRLPTARVAGSREVQLVLPKRGISVTVLSPHRALLRRIIASLRAVRVDGNGCPVRTPSGGFRLGSHPSGSASFVPAGAVRVVGCSYHGIWLDQSNRIGRGGASLLARLLDEAPYGLSRGPRGSMLPSLCGPTWRDDVVTERFEYRHGRPPVVVTAHVQGCSRLGASNGRWAVRIAPRWVFQLVTDAHYFGDFVDPRRAR